MTVTDRAVAAGTLPAISIRRAEPADLAEVLAVLNCAAAELHRRGVEQWLDGFGPDRLGPPVRAGYVYLAEAAGTGLAVATITLSPELDPDFWGESERSGRVLQVSKLARAPWAPRGTGAAVLRWGMDRAARSEVPVVRLDVWRTNNELRGWYLGQGFDYVRTEAVPGRRSGALFMKATAPDLEARDLEMPDWLARRCRTPLREGDRVRLVDDGRTGVVRHVEQADGSAPEDGEVVRLSRTYTIDLDDGGRVLRADIQVEPVWTDLT